MIELWDQLLGNVTSADDAQFVPENATDILKCPDLAYFGQVRQIEGLVR